MKNKIWIKIVIGMVMLSVSLITYYLKTNFSNDPICIENSVMAAESDEKSEDNKEPKSLMVDISGEVAFPQVLELKNGSRVFEAINQAGGLTDKADLTLISLAGRLKDEQKIYIPGQDKDNNLAGPIDYIDSADKDAKTVYVGIYGEIKSPAVIKINEDARIFHVVELAGGLTEKADTSKINLAEKVLDEMTICIPNKEQVAASSEGLININKADANQLKTLDGVGDATAKKIIDYRSSHGFFNHPEDIMQVPGIGPAKYAGFKDKIRVY